MYSRFFAFIGLFAFGMYTLVVSDNLLTLYIGWEIMGLCSYLLIGFWSFRAKDEHHHLHRSPLHAPFVEFDRVDPCGGGRKRADRHAALLRNLIETALKPLTRGILFGP